MFATELRVIPAVVAVIALGSCVAGAETVAGGRDAPLVAASSVGNPALPGDVPLLPGRTELLAAELVAEHARTPRSRWVIRVYASSANWVFEAQARLRAAGFSHVGRVRASEARGPHLWMSREEVTVHATLESELAGAVVYTVTRSHQRR